MTDPDPLTVPCPSCLAPAGAYCRTALNGTIAPPHGARIGDARAATRKPDTMLVDLLDADLNPPSDDLVLRALRARAGAYGLTVRIAPAEHAPDGAIYPLRLELVDARDARRTIAGYTASTGATCGLGLRTLLAVLP